MERMKTDIHRQQTHNPLVDLLLNLLQGALHLLLNLVHGTIDLRLVLVQEGLQALSVDDSSQLQMNEHPNTYIHIRQEAANQQSNLRHVIQSVPNGDSCVRKVQTGEEGHNRLHNVQESKHNPVDEPSTQCIHK